MKHVYSAGLPGWGPRPLAALALLLATAGAAHAQTPAATFAPVATYGAGGSNSYSIALADVNGDGKPDLLTANRGSDNAGVLLGNGNGTFQPATTFGTGTFSQPASIAVADVNGDGKPDLLTANQGTSTAGVLLGTGTGTFQPVTTFGTGFIPASIAVADVNGDGKPDLLTANIGSDNAGVLLGNGDGTFQLVTTFSTGTNSNPTSIAVADVNGDGKLDLLTANRVTDNAGVLLGTGTGTFQPVTTYSTGTNGSPASIAVADVNGDGKSDLLTANTSSSTAGVLLGNGDGTFRFVATFSTGTNSNPISIAVADVNGDGQLDLLTVGINGRAGVLLGTGTGTFQPVTTFGTGSIPASIAVADVNGDGQPDLLTAIRSGTAAVLLNTTVYAPTVTTAATSNTSTSASLGGTVTAEGGAPVTDRGVVYSSTIAMPTLGGAGVIQDANGAGPGSYAKSITGLTPGTTYYVRAYATNSAGTVYGAVQTFTTAGTPASTITALSPATGPVGTSVAITGTNLSGATGVSFNGTPASSFVVNSPTSLTAVVAAGTTTGLVTVTTPGGNATSSTSFVVRVPPTTVADAYTTPQNVLLTGNVLTNDIGTNPVAILIIRPTHGTLALNPDGSFTYQPATGYVGSDSFIYYACDPNQPLLCGNPVTVSLNVLRVIPITVADAYTVRQGATLTGNVLTNDIGTNPQAILIIRPTHGTLALNPDGTFTYQPAAGYVGPDSFLYYACNRSVPLVCGDPATVSISVLPAATATRPAAPTTAAAAKPLAAAELSLAGSPNPFSEQVRLSFTLPTTQAYTLTVYDGQGRQVQQLASGQAEAGQVQELTVPTYAYATGLYLVRLTTATGSQLLKLLKQ